MDVFFINFSILSIFCFYSQLAEKIDQTNDLVLHHSQSVDADLSASYLAELEESANKIDTDCLNIMEESNNLNSKLRKLNSGLKFLLFTVLWQLQLFLFLDNLSVNRTLASSEMMFSLCLL